MAIFAHGAERCSFRPGDAFRCVPLFFRVPHVPFDEGWLSKHSNHVRDTYHLKSEQEPQQQCSRLDIPCTIGVDLAHQMVWILEMEGACENCVVLRGRLDLSGSPSNAQPSSKHGYCGR